MAEQMWDNETNQLANQPLELETCNYTDNRSELFDAKGAMENYGLIDILLLTAGFVVVAAGTLFNSVILTALHGIPAALLKPKAVLTNSTVANSLGLLVYCASLFCNIFTLFQFKSSCLVTVRVILIPIVNYAQVFAYMFLSLDRLYAVVAPFRYRLQTNSTFGIVSVVFTWTIRVFITLPAFISAVTPPDPLRYCHQLRTGPQNSLFDARMLITSLLKLSTFCVSVFVFLFLKCTRKIARNCTTNTQRKDDLSMAMTFFLIHFLSLVSYIIAPLYALLKFEANFITSEKMVDGSFRVLMLLHLLNAIADPILLGKQIPVIRAQVLKMRKA